MIRQIRTLGLSMLAVFTVGVVASASASASTHAYFVCKEGGTESFTEHLCATKGETGKWSWAKVEGAETVKVEGTSGISKLAGEIAGEKVSIECSKDTFTGEIGATGLEKGGNGKGEYKFSECTLHEITKRRQNVNLSSVCTVANISFNVTDKLITGHNNASEYVEDEFDPTGAEGVFVEIKITRATCALKGTYKVAGSPGQVCAFPEATIGKVEHEIVCSSSGSQLKLNGNPAGLFSTETVKLSSGASWAAE
jgi:hypothetical protein